MQILQKVRKNWAVIVFTVLTTIGLSSFAFLQRANPLVIFKGNIHDAPWHIALMEQINKGLPPDNPLVSGEKVTGYHYLTDIALVGVHRLTGISFLTLYLQIVPYVLAGLFGLTTIWLFIKIFGKNLTAYLGASIAVFGSGLSFYAPLLFPQARVEQSMFWLDQSPHYGLNLQLLLSLSLVNVIFALLRFHTKKKWWLAGMLIGLLGGIKVYGWIVVVASVGLIGLLQWITKREWRWLAATNVGIGIGGLYFLLVGNHTGFPFIWMPGWFWQKMFESVDRLNMPVWELRRQKFTANHETMKLILLWLQAIVVFFLGNFSLKIFGLGAGVKLIKEKLSATTYWWWLVFVVAVVSLAIPSLFLQKGVVWNSIQFMHYAQIPLALLLTWLVTKVFSKQRMQRVVLAACLAVMVPTTIQTFVINSQPNMYVHYDPQLVASLKALRTTHTDKELLVGPALFDTSLVSALSGRVVYWADPINTTVLGVEHPERQQYVRDLREHRINCPANQVFVDIRDDVFTVSECPF